MGFVGIVLLFGGIVLYEMPRLLRSKLWRELVVFLGLVFLGFILSWLQAMGLPTRSWANIVGGMAERIGAGLGSLRFLR